MSWIEPRRVGRKTRHALKPVIIGGVVAAIASTLVQGVLWLAFTDAFPEVLYRDARLAAAIVAGPGVLARSSGFDAGVMALASVVHFVLSIAYAALFCSITRKLPPGLGILAGAGLGATLYGANMYGFTALFPWFVASRDWITLCAHLVFGASCVAACRVVR